MRFEKLVLICLFFTFFLNAATQSTHDSLWEKSKNNFKKVFAEIKKRPITTLLTISSILTAGGICYCWFLNHQQNVILDSKYKLVFNNLQEECDSLNKAGVFPIDATILAAATNSTLAWKINWPKSYENHCGEQDGTILKELYFRQRDVSLYSLYCGLLSYCLLLAKVHEDKLNSEIPQRIFFKKHSSFENEI